MSAASRSHSLFARTFSARSWVGGPGVEPRALLAAGVILLGVAVAACGSSSSTPKDGGTGTGGAGTAGVTGGGTGGKGTGGTTVGKDGGVTGSGGAGGSGTGTGTVTASLGLPCSTDHDCGSVLICMQADGNRILGAAGPAGGYCSFACSAGTDANCTAANGTCENVNTTAAPKYYCFQNCTLQEDPTKNNKCQQRTDVSCQPTSSTVGATAGVCFPTCSSDGECPTGRVCLFNFCVDTTVPANVPGLPLYSHCDTKAVAPTTAADPVPAGLCQESCLGSSMGTLAFCSTNCVLGSDTACNYALMSTALATGVNHGVCTPYNMGDQIGDVGYCVQQCDAAKDCRDQTDTGLTCDTTVMGLDHGFCNWM